MRTITQESVVAFIDGCHICANRNDETSKIRFPPGIRTMEIMTDPRFQSAYSEGLSQGFRLAAQNARIEILGDGIEAFLNGPHVKKGDANE